jgi:hypothetical protein
MPIDWPEVERIVKAYADGKTKVNMDAVLKAVDDQMPALKEYRDHMRAQEYRDHVHAKAHFIGGCLQRLGFTCRSRLTYERAAHKAAETTV